MVQIMNSGQSSRNRAERASLDFPPGVPSASKSNSEIDSHTTEIVMQPIHEIGEALIPEERPPLLNFANIQEEEEEEEEEDLERGGRRETYDSMPDLLSESNNNLSELNKDYCIITDPWAASSAVASQDEIEGTLLKKKNAKARNRKPKSQNVPRNGRRASKTSAGSGGHSSRKAKRRRNSSSNKDSKELAANSSSYDNTIDPNVVAAETTDSTETTQLGFKPILYCYRCFKRYPTYAAWRKHAVYEHILTKNPYPIVEMNYINTASLQFGLCTETAVQSDLTNSLVEDELLNEPIESVSGGEGSPKEQLKIKFCKEKGTYFVKQSSVSEEPSVSVTSATEFVEIEPLNNNVDLDDVFTSIQEEPVDNNVGTDIVFTSNDTEVVRNVAETDNLFDSVCELHDVNNDEINTALESNEAAILTAVRSILEERLENDPFVTTSTSVSLVEPEILLSDALEKDMLPVDIMEIDAIPEEAVETDEIPKEAEEIETVLPEVKSAEIETVLSEVEAAEIDTIPTEAAEIETVLPEVEAAEIETVLSEVEAAEIETIPTEAAEIETALPEVEAAEIETVLSEVEAAEIDTIPKAAAEIETALPEVTDEDIAMQDIEPEVIPITSILQQRLQNRPPSSIQLPPKSSTKALEIRKPSSALYQRSVSIETELSTILNDDEFEKALEQATERSRTFAAMADQNAFVFGSSDNGDVNNIPTATRGGIKTSNPTQHNIPTDTNHTERMISQDLTPKLPHTAEVHIDDEPLSKESTIQNDKEDLSTQNDTSVSIAKDKVIEDSVTPEPETETTASQEGQKLSDGKDNQELNSTLDKNDESSDSESFAGETAEDDKREEDGTKTPVEVQTNNVKENDEIIQDRIAEKEAVINDNVSDDDDEEVDNEEAEPAQVDSDDFECRVCHKRFLSDEEVNEHFSQEHFRISMEQGILEPESPFPNHSESDRIRSSIFAEDERVENEELEESPNHQNKTYSAALAGLLQKNNQVANSSMISGITQGLPHPDFNRAPLSRGQPMYVQQHSVGPRPLNPNVRMLHPGLPNMRPPLTSAPNSFNVNQNGPRYATSNGGSGRPILHMNRPGNIPPQLSQRPTGYPTSLHNALISNNGQATHGPIRSGGQPVAGPGGMVPQRPPLRPIQPQQQQQHHQQQQQHHHQQQQHQQQQQQQANQSNGPRVGQPVRGPNSNGPYVQFQQTIAQQQYLINEQHNSRNREAIQQQQLKQLQLQKQRQQQQELEQLQKQRQQQHEQEQLQQKHQQQRRQEQQQHIPQMPRLQQYPQQAQAQAQQAQQQAQHQSELQLRSMNDPQRMVQVNRPQPPMMQGKRPATIEMVEVNNIRGNKQPRMDNQFQSNQSRNLPPAEITISPRIVSSNEGNNNINSNRIVPNITLERNVAAAIGSVGSSGVNSVRLGNAITLSVCPTSSEPSRTAQTPPSNVSSNPAVNQNQSSRNSSRSPSPALNPHQVSSVLAVRGVTVTPASPPITSISPASSTNSNPSPSGSPSLHHQHQQHSVIQRASASNSPIRNYSPPVTTNIRHPFGPSQNAGRNTSPHNFAMPKAPPPRPNNPSQPPNVHSPSYINSGADRPDRPPTVDLTDDDIQAYNNQMRLAGMPTVNLRQAQPQSHPQQHQQQPGEQVRRVVASGNQNPGGIMHPRQTVRHGCCGLLFDSIRALEEHKLATHSQRPNFAGGPRLPQTAVRSSGIQIREVRSLNPQQLRMAQSPPVRAPSSVMRPQAPTQQQQPPQPPTQYQIRQATGSPSRPTLPPGNNVPAGKYLYIPLLDLTRMDPAKMSLLEEIGISCVVPLHGNSSLSNMGIPVMNLRANGIMNHHIPWDSVLPMGPVHQPPPPNRGVNPNVNGALPRSQQ